jgi:hypothetical protein
MSEDGAVPDQAELVYAPEHSWAPAMLAVGLGLAGVGVVFGWVALAVGAVFVLASLVRCWRDASDQFVRLPRRQRPTAAILPAVPLRRPRG